MPPLDELRPEHVDYVRAVVTRFHSVPSHARDDLVQDVLVQVLRVRSSRLEARAFLFGVTRHVVAGWIRRQMAERAALAERSYLQLDGHRSAEEEHEAKELAAIVHAALGELPEIFREIFVLVELEGLVMPEVVLELGIPLNTGYTRLRLARERFLAALQRQLIRRHRDRDG